MAFYSLSICSGVGGLDLAIHLAAPDCFTPIAMVEGEAFAACVLAARMADKALPSCPIWSDAKTVCDAAFRAYVRDRTGGQGIDFVFGGIPCQPHSVAGKQLGADDPRDLWPATVRILETYRPWLFFLENVPGMLGDVSARAVPDLQRLGYVVPRPLLLEAAAVGAPQRRERLFILAYREGANRRLLLRPRKSRQHYAESVGRGESVADSRREQPQGEQPGRATPGATGRSDGATLEQPSSGRRGKRKPRRGSDRRAATGEASGASSELGDSDGAERGTQRIADGGRPGGEGIGDRASGVSMEQSSRDVQRGESGEASGGIAPGPDAAAIGSGGIPYWPPGPADRSEWERILAIRPDLAPAVESAVRRDADGRPLRLDSTRVDELRSLGNMVVPLQGALAFLILLERLRKTQ